MPTEGRVRLAHADRREQLLELAVEVFGSRAYDEVSMDEMAELAGVSKGLLYHYFPTKGDFFVAAVEHTSRQVLAVSEPDPALPPGEQLAASVDGFLVWAQGHRRAYWTFTRGGLGVDRRVQDVIARHRTTAVERVLSGYHLAHDPATVLAAHGWLGFLDAATLQWLETGQPVRRQVLAQVLDVFAAALRLPGDAAALR